MSVRATLFSFAILLAYVALGGTLFYYLESDQELKTRAILKQLQRNLTCKLLKIGPEIFFQLTMTF